MKEESKEVIRLLMEKSDWGKNSSLSSLLHDFENEAKEFVEGVKKENQSNAIEEASDVLMIMLCALYRLAPDCESVMIDMLTEQFIQKLHMRYPHLYGLQNGIGEQTESYVWANAKKHEHTAACMFCDNRECRCYHQLGKSNIKWKKRQYICIVCGKRIPVSEETTLFYSHHRYRMDYIERILDSIRAFVRGDNDAVSLFLAEHEMLCVYLANELIGTEKQSIFSQYAADVIRCDYTTVERYFDLLIKEITVKLNGKSETTMDIYDRYIVDYCNSIRLNNKSPFTLLPGHERDAILKVLTGCTMDIEQKVELSMKYNARSWDNQRVTKLLLKFDSERIIECMAIIHCKGTSVNDMTVEVSSMYNCLVGCRFCASGALPASEEFLTPMDYLRQVNTCLKEIGANPRDFTNFYVSFAGIGEPSAVYKNVADGMLMIQDAYPGVKFNIASFGFGPDCFDFWKKGFYPIRTLQIPYYSCTDSVLRSIVKNLPHDYSFQKIVRKALSYQETRPECRVKINYLVMSGINDSDMQVEAFIQAAEEFKDRAVVKISYLNYTRPGRENGFKSPGMKRLGEIQTMLVRAGYTCYVFGIDANTGLGCGQLVQNNISTE